MKITALTGGHLLSFRHIAISRNRLRAIRRGDDLISGGNHRSAGPNGPAGNTPGEDYFSLPW